ncbi:MAG TPA: hypothetical protein VGC53_13440 [Vicinamibacteria bacterium]
MTTDREDAAREHRSTLIRDYLIEAFPDHRLAPDWWDTTHGEGEQCFRLDGERDFLEVRVTRPLMMEPGHTVEEIQKLLESWNPETHKRVRVTEQGLRPF